MQENEVPGRRRRATLIKKAKELSILCDAEVAVIAFTSDGKLHEYSTNSVEHTLSRYQNYKSGLVRATKMESDAPEECRREAVSNEEVQKSSDEVLHALKGQHAALELDKLRREGKALDGLSREELCALEIEQHRALESVLKKKEELLVRLVHKSNKERDRHQAIQERTREIPYLQLFPENSTGFSTSSKAVSLSNCPTQDMDIDLLRLRL
ncbi:PREDICTED: agamous-like MADS-box protein AGL15 [Fragaria vesca subsp. vesca]|uniref:agamous-like MADS-box protein AGL15 n=1 Tax=Fragaria vesca subsp. vesca TaxID=101020 RepID=UPI0002C2FBDD|nr:PREDICTED: agamous-like MADS-box protein AGL15 [Fragaria vesca subsp. vesca]